MITIKTLTNTKSKIKTAISYLKIMGSGSITLNDKVQIPVINIGPTDVYYKLQNEKIIITFNKNPTIHAWMLEREVKEIEISEKEIILKVAYFPDLRIEIKS